MAPSGFLLLFRMPQPYVLTFPVYENGLRSAT